MKTDILVYNITGNEWWYQAYGPSANIQMIAATGGVTLQELAHETGLSQHTVYDIKNKRVTHAYKPTCEALMKAMDRYTGWENDENIQEFQQEFNHGCRYYIADNISTWMRYRMLSLGLTPKDFDVTAKTIYNIMDGSHKPTRTTIASICETTGDRFLDVYHLIDSNWNIDR